MILLTVHIERILHMTEQSKLFLFFVFIQMVGKMQVYGPQNVDAIKTNLCEKNILIIKQKIGHDKVINFK